MAVRMRAVAQAAGVSTATVSLALSGNARIPAETRARIIDVAEGMRYRPHAGARSLRTDLTGSFGLVVSDVANPFFGELAGEIQRSAVRRGYSLVLCNSDEDVQRQDEYLQSLLAGSRVDGILLVSAAAMTPGLEAAGHAKARLVFLDRPVAVPASSPAARHLSGCPVIRSDASAAVREAARLFVQHGHRRVGIIAPPLETRVGVDRRDLMIRSLTDLGVAPGDITVVAGDFRQDSGERAIRQLLGLSRPPTAVFGADGLMTIGAMTGLRRAGMRVPDDISLVGFDDAPWFELFDPPLTAIAQPIAALADAAVAAMVGLINGAAVDSAETSLACHLVSRRSVGPAPP